MVNPRLKDVCSFVESWCADRGVNFGLVCDESDLQGVLVPKKSRHLVSDLLTALSPTLTTNGVHLETTKVRGGTILAFSLKAISESRLAALIAEAGEELEKMSFVDKITDAFVATTAKRETVNETVVPNEGTFLSTAARLVGEGQYKSATQGMTRSNQTSLQRQSIGPDRTLGGKKKPPAPKPTTPPPTAPVQFENRVGQIFGSGLPTRTKRDFARSLTETLQGMATPSGAQPGDLFTKFAGALSALGQNMGTGPLQDQLKKQGINWKKSDDGQSVVLYIVNASTNAPQPIARISAATLEKPSDFEAQLLNIMDFAKGDAPGTFKQRQQEFQAQEKAAREIAKQLGPQDPNAVQMGQPAPQQQMGQQPAPQPQQPAPQPGAQPAPQPAPQAAAQQAGMPKPTL